MGNIDIWNEQSQSELEVTESCLLNFYCRAPHDNHLTGFCQSFPMAQFSSFTLKGDIKQFLKPVMLSEVNISNWLYVVYLLSISVITSGIL